MKSTSDCPSVGRTDCIINQSGRTNNQRKRERDNSMKGLLLMRNDRNSCLAKRSKTSFFLGMRTIDGNDEAPMYRSYISDFVPPLPDSSQRAVCLAPLITRHPAARKLPCNYQLSGEVTAGDHI